MPSNEPITISHPRLAAFDRIIREMRDGRYTTTSAWLEFLTSLPMVLGQNEADWNVPYACSDRLWATMQYSVEGLLDLLRRRNDPEYDSERRRALLPDEKMRVVLQPKRTRPRTIPDESPMRTVVARSLLEEPDLDGGLMESWLSRQGGGLALFQSLNTILGECARQAMAQPDMQGILNLVFLALLDSTLEAKQLVKRTKVPGFTYARLDRVVGMALHACFATATTYALMSAGIRNAGEQLARQVYVIQASLGPNAFISISRNVLQQDVNPYGVPAGLEELMEPVYLAALERDNRPSGLLARCLAEVESSKKLNNEITRAALIEGLRRFVLSHLLDAEDPRLEGDKLLSDALRDNSALATLLDNQAVNRSLQNELSERLEKGRLVKETMPSTRKLLLLLQLKSAEPEVRERQIRTLVQQLLERFLLKRLDEFSQQHLLGALQRVRNRRKDLPVDQLAPLYQQGKLYRVATDDQPLIKLRAKKEQGQLFVDIKGYTRLTARAKELSMADFLSQEFYQPILEAAKKYRAGAMVSSDQPVDLVNLLGDAVAFSGDIMTLVDLAGDIQKILRQYRTRLEQRASLSGKEQLEQVTRRVEQRRASLMAEINKLDQRLREIQQEVFHRSSMQPARLAELVIEQMDKHKDGEKAAPTLAQLRSQLKSIAAGTKVTDRKRKELVDMACRPLLARLRSIEQRRSELLQEDLNLEQALAEERTQWLGTELEAGLFISYGTAAERIEFSDDVWGNVHVSIGERINEAARGTARNGSVLRIVMNELEQARAEAANPKLEMPFRVYIRPLGELELDPYEKALWRKAIEKADHDAFEHLLQRLRSHYNKKLEQRSTDMGHLHFDIYNVGEAISAPALDAYARQGQALRHVFPVRVALKELHPEIRNRFFIDEPVLELIVSLPRGKAGGDFLLFRKAGQVVFRGFERSRPTGVYEIMRRNNPFVALVEKHHLMDWVGAFGDMQVELLTDGE